MIALATSTDTKNNIISSAPSFATIGCISIALLFAASSTNAPNFNIINSQISSPAIITTQSSEFYAYNSGNNIISYFTEDYMSSNMLRESLVRLDEIKNLEYNWNGYGAEPFSASMISQIEKIIRNLSKQPEIYPTAQSSIQLEYNNENGDYLEFEIFDNGVINQFLLKSNGESISQKRIPKNTLNKVIESFYGQSI